MKKIIIAVFAHPDDEAFGPSGTLLLETRSGSDLHLITLTAGENGTNPDNHESLGAVRLEEWHKAGKLMGATSMHHLGYIDGTLNNEIMIEASTRIIKIAKDIIVSAPTEAIIEFMTNDLNGISGHIDHIVAAHAACYAFYSLKSEDPRISRIRLTCLPEEYMPASNIDWLYMEAGRPQDEIDEIVDAHEVRDEIIKIMRTHHTQRDDGEGHIDRLKDKLGINYFIDKT